ncbi:hypothetical protein LUU34_00312900 [Aix galericulata]|nr:hypothetical protein LUU34_00312900 [Aix galericulata]
MWKFLISCRNDLSMLCLLNGMLNCPWLPAAGAAAARPSLAYQGSPMQSCHRPRVDFDLLIYRDLFPSSPAGNGLGKGQGFTLQQEKQRVCVLDKPWTHQNSCAALWLHCVAGDLVLLWTVLMGEGWVFPFISSHPTPLSLANPHLHLVSKPLAPAWRTLCPFTGSEWCCTNPVFSEQSLREQNRERGGSPQREDSHSFC